MKTAVIFFSVFCLVACQPAKESFDKNKEQQAILAMLKAQEAEWNKGNIDGFMEGYWKSDSLMFIGSGITKGWTETLQKYKKGYPDTLAMGKLDFTFYEFRFLSNESCLVTGQYHLKRAADEPRGMFTLLIRKINGSWVVAYDHTS